MRVVVRRYSLLRGLVSGEYLHFAFLKWVNISAICLSTGWLGHEKVVKVLIENRADVNLKALAGVTPLHLAVNKGIIFDWIIYWTLFRSLFELNHPEKYERVTEQSAEQRETHVTLVDHLSKYMGFCFASIGTLFRISIIRAWARCLNLILTSSILRSPGHEKVVKILIENQADVNAMGKDRETPLHIAVGNGNISNTQIYRSNP